jgi:hypothetical protein
VGERSQNSKPLTSKFSYMERYGIKVWEEKKSFEQTGRVRCMLGQFWW